MRTCWLLGGNHVLGRDLSCFILSTRLGMIFLLNSDWCFDLHRKAVKNECELQANIFYNSLHRCFFLFYPLFSLFMPGLLELALINRPN